ncbi:hypothetical protein IDJ77_12930 [Mucilaginibacter sp. ZT4R22]|uniref:Uncharacterized protein n=1 Tax=Mucilaginibacter pankratovii TaxID=2772110 RepID=A0ABR7WT65_9SPHI|nr:hypothetical protein [Mucilaginibacter pankratovii]MBD1364717.1 hypothetical protein [Mucilaginibacter pankratovii]
MKILTPAMHGTADYLMVLFLWSAPTFFVLPDDLGRFAYLLGIAHLALTVCTNTTSGIFRFFSMPLHGLIKFSVSIILVTISYTIFKYDDRARAFFLTYAVLLLVLFLVTDYTGSESKVARRLKGSARLPGPNTAL